MIRKLVHFSLAVFLSSAVASAQVKFEQKYPEGSKSVVQRESKSTQTLTLAGRDLDTASSTFLLATTTIGTRSADGILKIEEKADSLQTDISLPGGLKLQFDSANPDKKADLVLLEPILDILRAAYRLPVTIELDANNKLSNVKLPDGEFEKLPDAAKNRLSSEELKKTVEQAQACLPDAPVKKGDTWERASDMNLGDGQRMSFRTTYEYVGTVEQDGTMFDKISGKSFDVSFSITGNPTLQVTKSELKVIESEATILFNRELGSVTKRASKTRIAGPITLVIMGMELPGKVDLTIEENSTRQK